MAGAGIKDTDTLLTRAKTRKDRDELAEQSGIDGKLILKWANMVDLFRVSGIGAEYSELLKASGVDTVKELQHRNAENLQTKLVEINDQKSLTRRVPTVEMVTDWIDQAKSLPATLEY